MKNAIPEKLMDNIATNLIQALLKWHWRPEMRPVTSIISLFLLNFFFISVQMTQKPVEMSLPIRIPHCGTPYFIRVCELWPVLTLLYFSWLFRLVEAPFLTWLELGLGCEGVAKASNALRRWIVPLTCQEWSFVHPFLPHSNGLPLQQEFQKPWSPHDCNGGGGRWVVHQSSYPPVRIHLD